MSDALRGISLAARGEVVVADNGSNDGSARIYARSRAAFVVHVPDIGYGNALRIGIQASRGTFIIMGDADGSHDLTKLVPFLEKLRSGDDVVVGNRFGRSVSQSCEMNRLSCFIGTPLLTMILKLFYSTPIHDSQCGFRAISREAYDRLSLNCPGMEFASELLIKASLGCLTISEVPILHRRDGRSRAPHLRPIRDGWRHLRLLFVHCPLWRCVYSDGSGVRPRKLAGRHAGRTLPLVDGVTRFTGLALFVARTPATFDGFHGSQVRSLCEPRLSSVRETRT